MKVLSSLFEIDKIFAVKPDLGLTIGNFDGVHLGHRQLIKKIKDDCREKNLKFCLVTFIPHPQKILHPEKSHLLINSYEERRKILEELGVDILVEMKFTRDFSTLRAESFLNQHLLSYEGLKVFYLGYDFAFGANKEGTHDIVRSLCAPRGIAVDIQPKFELHGKIVSSSLIRDKLLTGNLADLDSILKRPFHLEGVVVKGEGRGRKIGFPTANIQVDPDLIIPQKGVYVTRTSYKGMIYQSVTNIGNNPTFKDTEKIHIETNLFDFNNDIYGESLRVDFLSKIRDEKKFATVNELIEQIKSDVDVAKKILGQK